MYVARIVRDVDPLPGLYVPRIESWRTKRRGALLHHVSYSDGAIYGFVIDPARPLVPLTIELLFDGVSFAMQLCVGLVNVREIDEMGLPGYDAVKDVLHAATHGTRLIPGRFHYELPAYLPRDRDLHVKLRVPETGELLLDRSMRFDAEALRALSSLLDGQPRVKFLALSLEADRLCFSATAGGVGCPPQPVARTSELALKITSHTRAMQAPPNGHYLHQPDVPYWQLSGTVELCGSTPGFEIRLHDADGKALGYFPCALFVPPDCVREHATWSIPDAKRRVRVMGYDDALAYYFAGYATFVCVDRALRHVCGKGLDGYSAILDWGSGCGRLTQHLARRTKASVHGIDIDAENVEWSRRNIENAAFSVTPLMPPSPLPARSFDLVTGISVFTHLDRASEAAWLGELHRLLRPGGVALVSIRSSYGLYCDPHPIQRYWDMRHRGIDDGIAGFLLDDVLAEGSRSYYRETNHAHEHVMNVWSRWFDVLGLFSGAHFDFQDFCVLRRRERPETFVGPLE